MFSCCVPVLVRGRGHSLCSNLLEDDVCKPVLQAFDLHFRLKAVICFNLKCLISTML